MSYLVLARRWRPQKFEEVIGQEHVTRTLVNAMTTGRLAHGFLFAGTRGVGKTTVARLLAKAINCLGPVEHAPCNQCDSCIEINEGRSVDVQEIDGASNNSVDQVRELRENARYLPARARRKVYVIDEVHMLSKGAFNALLKTLEEPPEHVAFIFATTEVHKVPATILSRCQRYDFRPVPAGALADHLLDITGREKIDLSPAAAAILARSARGSVRDSLSLLDQTISFAGETIGEQEVQDILGMVDPRLVWNLASAVLSGDGGAALTGIEDVSRSGHDWWTVYTELMTHFRNLIVLKVDPRTGAENLGLSEAETAELRRQADAATPETLQLCLEGMLESERMLRSASAPRFAMELALLKLCRLTPVVGLGDIITSLDQLAQRLDRGEGELPSGDGSSAGPAGGQTPSAPPGEAGGGAPPAPSTGQNQASRASVAAQREPPPPAPEGEDYGLAKPDGGRGDYQAVGLQAGQPEDPGSVRDEAPLEAAPGQDMDPVKDWNRFLNHLNSKQPVLAKMLKSIRPREVRNTVLKLELHNGSGLMDDPDRVGQLQERLSAFFGRKLKVELARAANGSTPRSRMENRRRFEKQALEDPVVKAAMNTFGIKSISVNRAR